LITILTYHDVVTSSSGNGIGHYAVTPELLREHILVLQEHGFLAVDPGQLQNPSQIGSASFFLTFDDGQSNHANLTAPLLESFGIRGVFFVPTCRIDRDAYLKSEDIRRMTRAGHIFGLHGHEHRRLDLLSKEELKQDFVRSMEILAGLTGEPPWIFAPVGGYTSSQVTATARNLGVRAIRTMRWGLNSNPIPFGLETIPVSRDFSSAQLLEILRSGNFGRGYRSKELLKSLLPETLYNRVRETVSRIAKGLTLPSPHG
jgi:peptidoglycan/xylan/chitin deacetylase (PgdA/CDA1 family)